MTQTTTHGNTAKALRKIAEESAQSWQLAIDTAGPEYDGGSLEHQQDARDAAEECARLYREGTVDALRAARAIESEWGDCSFADRALELLTA